jgi:hypothetical protein
VAQQRSDKQALTLAKEFEQLRATLDECEAVVERFRQRLTDRPPHDRPPLDRPAGTPPPTAHSGQPNRAQRRAAKRRRKHDD